MVQTETSDVIALSDDSSEWWNRIDVSKIDEDSRYKILSYLVEKYGRKKVMEEAGISRVTLWRLLNRVSPVDPEYVAPLLKLLKQTEFESLVSAKNRLRSLGIMRDDGTVDYSLVLEILSIARSDEYLKNAVLRFVIQEFREDIRKMLGISFTGIKLEWSEDFENFLVERKKRRKVKDPETVKYYRNLFKRYLEGKELSEELIDYIVRHQNKWLRNVFRHYVQYLYHKRRIPPETFGWIMEVVPSRGYKLDVRPYQISIEDVKKTLEFLKENHRPYYTVYRAMLESGARFEHVLEMIRTWRPDEVVVIESIDLETERLVCFDNRGFCRYYLGLRGHQKPCEWIYMSRGTIELLKTLAPKDIDRNSVRRYARRHSLTLPKMFRKVSWRIMVQTMPREVARFIQSRFGELRVSEARYEDLLSEADEYYLKYLEKLEEVQF
ncbi:MAG: integrase [Sulfolobales archaeon]